jgi:hypothetical protein
MQMQQRVQHTASSTTALRPNGKQQRREYRGQHPTGGNSPNGEIATHANWHVAKTWAIAQGAMRVEGFAWKPAELTGPRHELCTWGEPTRPGVGGRSRKRHTQCVEHNRKGSSGGPRVGVFTF